MKKLLIALCSLAMIITPIILLNMSQVDASLLKAADVNERWSRIISSQLEDHPEILSDEDILKAQALINVDISNVALTDKEASELFTYFPQVINLKLKNNLLTKLDFMKGEHHVKQLDVSGNAIRDFSALREDVKTTAYDQKVNGDAIIIDASKDLQYTPDQIKEPSYGEILQYEKATYLGVERSLQQHKVTIPQSELKENEMISFSFHNGESGNISGTLYVPLIYRTKENDATLSSLDPGAGLKLMQEFSADTYRYDVLLPRGTNKIKINASTSQKEAVIQVDDLKEQSMDGVEHYAYIHVTAKDGKHKQTYQIHYIQEGLSDDVNGVAKLKSLSLNDNIRFSPKFDPDVLLYKCEVGASTSSIVISASPLGDASIAEKDLDRKELTIGDNTFTILVSAYDSSLGKDVSRLYTLVITRKTSEVAHLSSDATLKSLSFGSYAKLEPEFSPNIKEYTAVVPSDTTYVDIKAEAANAKGEVSIYALGKKAVVRDNQMFAIPVTAQDGSESLYAVKVVKSGEGSSRPNSTAQLRTLSVCDMEQACMPLRPYFEPGVDSYELEVDYDVDRIRIQAEVLNEGSILGEEGIGVKELTVGKNTFVIHVLDENKQIHDYTIVIKRQKETAEKEELSNKSKLKELSVFDESGKPLSLSPYFNSDVKSYVVKTYQDSASIALHALPEHKEVEVDHEDLGVKQLTKDEETFTIHTQGEDGTQNSYSVLVVRSEEREIPSDELDHDSSLKSLSVKGFDKMKPAFDPNIMDYTLVVNDQIDYITINANANSPQALIKAGDIGDKTLKYGENHFMIRNVANDGSIRVYNLNVIRRDKEQKAYVGIALSTSALTLEAGSTYKLQAETLPKKLPQKNLLYKALDDSIIKVDAKGNIKGKQPGVTTLIVKSEDETLQKAIKVKVTDKDKLGNKVIELRNEDQKIEVSGALDTSLIVDSEDYKEKKIERVEATIRDASLMRDYEIQKIYDISLKQGEETYKIKDEVEVRIRLDKKLKKQRHLDVVYIGEDGSVEYMNAKVKGDYIVFQTSHFSQYAIVAKTSAVSAGIAASPVKRNGDIMTYILYAILIGGSALILYSTIHLRNTRSVHKSGL